ncbi:MAG: asparagine synthase-related protein [Rhizomicrobium sp.]
MSRRGPDRRGQWSDGSVGLGHLLLRITREDAFDAQPVQAGPLALVADLRLDNREALAPALGIPPAALAELPDSAILLKAYDRWGEACVEHLVGDFAFALWNGATRVLLLARDPMGQRHLHYYLAPDFFVFASEPAGLLALPDVPQTLDLSTLARRLAIDRAPSHGMTTFKGVLGLEGGTVMRVTAAGDVATRRYWEPHADPRHLNRDEAYYVKAYREVLGEAVACRVGRARRPAALLLGGGFDSGAIAGLAGAALAGQDRKFVCVASVAPDDAPARGVRRWAHILGRHMPHLDLRFVTREGLDVLQNLDRDFFRTGEPGSPNRYVSDALYAAAASAGARVVMDGHGGDYTLNPRGAGWLARRLLRGELRSFLREFRAYRRHSGASLAQALKSEVAAQLLPLAVLRRWRRVAAGLSPFGPAAPVTPAFLAAASGSAIETGELARRGEPAPQMARILRRQQSAHAIGGALLAAAHGLEFTQPYHDKRVVELALAIPETLHVRNGRDRYLARRALADIYPPEFQARGRANDELTPDFAAMAERIKPALFAEIARLQGDESLAGLFDFAKMRRMLERRVTRRSDTAARHAIRTLLYARFIEWQRRGN